MFFLTEKNKLPVYITFIFIPINNIFLLRLKKMCYDLCQMTRKQKYF